MTLELTLEKRDIFGKKLQSSREEGKMPAVVYGNKSKESQSFFVVAKDFKKLFREAGESTAIVLDDGGKKLDVLVHDVSFHPLTGEPLHVDFLLIDMKKITTANVPLNFEGVAPAVKEKGGLLVKVLHEMEVEALPKDLPQEIIIDISKLVNMDDNIAIKDVTLPDGVKATGDEDDIVVSVAVPKEEVEEERTIEDVQVEKKGKKEEEEIPEK